MKKQLVIIGILAPLVCVGLSGCTNNPLDIEKNRFIGTWKTNPVNIDWTFDFFSDGTFQRMGGVLAGGYEIKDGRLVLTYSEQSVWSGHTFNYSFSNDYKTLTLIPTSSNESVVLYKQ